MPVPTNAQALLDAAVEAQQVFWDAVGALENALGIEIDSSEDLSNTTMEDLLEEEED